MDLTTFDNYMLLSVHPNTGKPMAGMFYFGLVGALFIDLHKQELLQVGNEFLVVSDNTLVNIPIVDYVLQKINTSKEYKKIYYWLPLFARNKAFKKLLFKYMNENNIIKVETKTILGISFPRFNIDDTTNRKSLVYNLREDIKRDKPTNLLLGLLISSNLDSILVTNSISIKKIKESCLCIQKENTIAFLVSKVIHKQKLIDLWIAIFLIVWVLLIFAGSH